MSVLMKDIISDSNNIQSVTVHEAIKTTCKAIEVEQSSISNILKSEMKRLEVLAILIEKEYIFTETPDSLIREVNNVIKSLIAYDCLIENKLNTVYRLYNDMC